MKISVHIEHLILEGLPVARHQGVLVQAAVEAELARLLAEGQLDPQLLSGGAVPRLAANTIQLSPAVNPTRLGQQIAQAVHGGISE
jgi:hypothetical protein